jgi:hypothetical protein
LAEAPPKIDIDAVAVMPLAKTSEEAMDKVEALVTVEPAVKTAETEPEMVASACAATGSAAAIARAIIDLFIEIPLQ